MIQAEEATFGLPSLIDTSPKSTPKRYDSNISYNFIRDKSWINELITDIDVNLGFKLDILSKRINRDIF